MFSKKSRTLRWCRCFVLAALILLPGALFPIDSPAATSEEPIKVGFLVSLSGAGADFSKEMVAGAQLYLNQISHRMGGRKVELIVENDESNPATAAAKLHKLIEVDKVQIVSGFFLTNIAYALAPLSDKYHVPFVITVATADDLTQRRHPKWLIRTSRSSSQGSQPFGEWAHRKLGFKRIVTIGSDYGFGWETVGGFQRSFEDAGGKVVQKLWAPLGFNDFSSLLKQIRPDADAVYIATVGPATEEIPKQYKTLGIKLPMIGSGATFEEDNFSHSGAAILGAFSDMPYSVSLPSADNEHFTKSYHEKTGANASYYSMCGYTSLLWINKAVDALKDKAFTNEQLLASLKSVELKDSPRGPMKLDAYGNPIQNIYIRKIVQSNGKLDNTVVDTLPNVSQFWKWKPEEYLKQPSYSRSFPPCKFCTGAK